MTHFLLQEEDGITAEELEKKLEKFTKVSPAEMGKIKLRTVT